MNRITRFLLGIYGVLLSAFLVFYFMGPELFLQWEVISSAYTEALPIIQFDKGPFSFSIDADVYSIREFFSGGEIAANTSLTLLLQGLMWFALCGLLAFSTHMKRFWFVVVAGLFILFVNHLDLDSLSVWGSLPGKKWLTGAMIIFVVGPAYYFHAFQSHISFLKRYGVIFLLTLVFLSIVYAQNPLLIEWTIARSNLGFAILAFIFICLIAEEIVFGILLLITKTRGGQHNEKHLIVFAGAYLAVIALYYAGRMNWVEIDLNLVNPYWLLAISSVVAIFTIANKQRLLEMLMVDHLDIRIPIFLLGIISFGYLAFAFSSGNDPARDGIEFLITYGHVAFGSMFLIYLIANFVDPLIQGLQVYKIAYTDQSFPYVTSRLAGFVAILGFFLLSEQEAYKQLRGAEYNLLGDYALANDETGIAMEYFRQGSIFAWDNHKSNYELGSFSKTKGDFNEYIYRFNRATKRNPTPQAFVNTARAYVENKELSKAISTLNGGLPEFGNSGELKNNLALYYDENGNEARAKQILNEGGRTDEWNQALEVNKFGLKAGESAEISSDDGLPLMANKLAWSIANQHQVPTQLDSGHFKNPTIHTYALVNNANLNGDPVALIKSDQFISQRNTSEWLYDFRLSQALGLYKSGNVDLAFRKLDYLFANSSSAEKGKVKTISGKLALAEHAPRLALDLFETALEYRHPEARYHLVLAAMEAQSWDLASYHLFMLVQEDSSYVNLRNNLSTIITGDQGESFAYYYYRPDELDLKNTTLLNQLGAAQVSMLWERKLLLDFNANRTSDLESEFQLIRGFIQDPIRQLSEQVLSHPSQIKDQNAFAGWQVLAATDSTQMSLADRYDRLLAATEINPYSVPLLKAYCFAAVDMSLYDYADAGYMRLYDLLSTEEMNSFADAYYEAVDANKKARASWRN